MRQNPRDWRIEEVETIARSYDIVIRKSSGSHVVLTHPQWDELLTVPARRPIKPVYIRRLVDLIDLLEST